MTPRGTRLEGSHDINERIPLEDLLPLLDERVWEKVSLEKKDTDIQQGQSDLHGLAATLEANNQADYCLVKREGNLWGCRAMAAKKGIERGGGEQTGEARCHRRQASSQEPCLWPKRDDWPHWLSGMHASGQGRCQRARLG